MAATVHDLTTGRRIFPERGLVLERLAGELSYLLASGEFGKAYSTATEIVSLLNDERPDSASL